MIDPITGDPIVPDGIDPTDDRVFLAIWLARTINAHYPRAQRQGGTHPLGGPSTETVDVGRWRVTITVEERPDA